MKRIQSAVIAALIFFPSFISAQTTSPDISADDLRKHITFLASEEMKGRLTGTPEALAAAEYIKTQFEQFGVKPVPGASFLQDYQFVSDVELRPDNRLHLFSDAGNASPALAKEFTPLAFSGSGTFSGTVVFAGYGISAPKLKYDDYENVDVNGKFVLVMRFNPEYDNPHTQFEEYSSFRYKAKIAREKGAIGIIFINGPYPKVDEDKLPELKYDRAQSFKDFAALSMKRSLVEHLFQIKYPPLAELQVDISKNKKPRSFEMVNVMLDVSVELAPVQKTGTNVIGYVKGSGGSPECVVIGAHYDHLGMGTDGSLYRGKEPAVHNGADDNASGTAGLLELAQKFAAEKNNSRDMIFVAFSGEELGLLGSNYFVNNPPVPTTDMTAMINLDMIGRLNPESSLILYGTGTSPLWKQLIDSLNTPYQFKITKNDEGYGPSDHASFYAKNMPVLFFFTGTHGDYHRPGDDVDKLNFPGEEKVLQYVWDVTSAIANVAKRPEYVNVPRKQGERTGGWSVYVGTIPDYAYQGEGLKITGVSEGSPAQKAGLQGGDIMIQFGETKVNNIYDYVYALKNHVPGDVVNVSLNRAGNIVQVQVELGAK